MRIQSNTADQAAQVAATAQQLESIVQAYGNPLSGKKTSFQMPADANLSKLQIRTTHYWLKSEYTPNFAQMVATFRKLLINAPYAAEKEQALRTGFQLLSHLQSIYNEANLTNYLAEITTDQRLKKIILSDATRHLNYGSLMAMEELRSLRDDCFKPIFPKFYHITSMLYQTILYLYVPKISDDEVFAMDALLNMLIAYDK